MEFCLVDDQPFVITDGPYCTADDWYLLYIADDKFPLEPLARYYCQSLLDRTGQIPTLNLRLLYPIDGECGRDQKCTLQIFNGDEINVLKRSKQWCEKDNVCVNLKLSQLNCNVGAGVDWFEAKDLPIKYVTDDVDGYRYRDESENEYGCELSDVNLPPQPNMCGRLTVSLKITKDAVDSLLLQTFTNSNLAYGNNKRLLEDAIFSDLVIRAANGTELKCHKGMLAVSSDVFKTMFENKMKESITSVVEMPDMSEQAVRAFLGFIYYGNRKEVSESCDLALELLVAADKYNVLDLLPAIAELITVMPNQWFNLDISMKLLIFTERQQEICENKDLKRLQEKAIRVLKSHTENSLDVLLNSEVYQQLLRNSPETAKQIHARFLSFALE